MRKKTVIAERNTQPGRDHVEGEHAPHDPVEVIFEQEDRSCNDSEEGNEEQKCCVDPVNPVEGNA